MIPVMRSPLRLFRRWNTYATLRSCTELFCHFSALRMPANHLEIAGSRRRCARMRHSKSLPGECGSYDHLGSPVANGGRIRSSHLLRSRNCSGGRGRRKRSHLDLQQALQYFDPPMRTHRGCDNRHDALSTNERVRRERLQFEPIGHPGSLRAPQKLTQLLDKIGPQFLSRDARLFGDGRDQRSLDPSFARLPSVNGGSTYAKETRQLRL
jgi:hypothetical protein